jgi:3D-(3,5/4)-trihydroxycyclohexane-1,2-dione acylhydrolase (decyclizing)
MPVPATPAHRQCRRRGVQSANLKGGVSFNNLIKDYKVKEPFGVDYAKHAESMGALVRRVEGLAELGKALDCAKTTDRTTVITIVSDAFTWTLGDALWDVGVPQVGPRGEVNVAAKYQADVRRKQRVGV